MKLTKAEFAIWFISAALVLAVGFLPGGDGFSTAASLLGITSLLYNAKGHPVGQLLMVLFSLMYGWISCTFRYYGEMITYLGMTLPMAVLALIAWIRHPYQGNRAEVAVNRIGRGEWLALIPLSLCVTALFYWILRELGNENLHLSTLSVLTSFVAAYLTFRRSAFFALAYAANDVVLIGLWALAALSDPSYWSVAACFSVFLANDLYGFFRWRRMERAQAGGN